MYGCTYGQKISPFYRTSSPIGAPALPPPMKAKEKVEQGKGTADHLIPLGYLFFLLLLLLLLLLRNMVVSKKTSWFQVLFSWLAILFLSDNYLIEKNLISIQKMFFLHDISKKRKWLSLKQKEPNLSLLLRWKQKRTFVRQISRKMNAGLGLDKISE